MLRSVVVGLLLLSGCSAQQFCAVDKVAQPIAAGAIGAIGGPVGVVIALGADTLVVHPLVMAECAKLGVK